ncbi:HEAT repeat domain-containing protein [Schlesneria paludicola]|uniref:HEAT repeat domain-containing protein n=1 Tax=Schlesneria paludicola TaxID=360056 RepID=UPI001ED965CE|nr:HEAT repeat domain-containing protein [Schlesneria paludicola]
MPRFRLVCCIISLFAGVSILNAAIEPDFLMDSDPGFRDPDRLKKFSPRLKTLWIEALNRPETDMQRMAAETISLAHQHGIPDLIESVPILESMLIADQTHPATRFAAARALIVLESRPSAEKLLHASQLFGADLRHLIEPVMAKWDVISAREIWIKRLESAETRPRDLLLAVRGLGEVREAKVLPVLLAMALDLVRGPEVRLAAAAAAGQLTETGLEADARRLVDETRTSPTLNRLCAIRLLDRHNSESARQLLIELVAADKQPVIVTPALERLNAIDSRLVLPLAANAMKNADQRVREQGALAYMRYPTVERIESLSQRLSDPHPQIRANVSENLVRLSQNPELNETIRARAMEVLAGETWQGQEQACLLLGSLQHKPASKRLIELLESSRPEVMIASAWALRKVADVESIPAIIDKIRRQTEVRLKRFHPPIDPQVAHLFEACAVMRAAEVTPMIIRYVPKNSSMGERSRSAAIWAIGVLLNGNPNETAADALMKRIEDDSPPDESVLVKQHCVIALARMKAIEHAPALRQSIATNVPPTAMGLAKRWAIKELTGEVLPEPIPMLADQGEWFLEPVLED